MPHEEIYRFVLLLEASCQLLDDGDGAVSAAGASDAQSEVGLALRGVAGNEEGEEVAGLLQEHLAVFGAENGLAHGRVVAGEGPELGVVMGVGKKTNVEKRVHVEGGTVLEAEGDEADGHTAREGLSQFLEPQAGVERGVTRGVYDEVGHLPDVGEVPPLAADGLQNVAVAGGRVGTAALLVAPQERGVVRVDKQDAVLPALRPIHGLQA